MELLCKLHMPIWWNSFVVLIGDLSRVNFDRKPFLISPFLYFSIWKRKENRKVRHHYVVLYRTPCLSRLPAILYNGLLALLIINNNNLYYLYILFFYLSLSSPSIVLCCFDVTERLIMKSSIASIGTFPFLLSTECYTKNRIPSYIFIIIMQNNCNIIQSITTSLTMLLP